MGILSHIHRRKHKKPPKLKHHLQFYLQCSTAECNSLRFSTLPKDHQPDKKQRIIGLPKQTNTVSVTIKRKKIN